MIKKEYATEQWPSLHQRLFKAYASLLRSGRRPVIIDAGANIGMATLWFARLFPQARIYAIEPDRENLHLLCENVAGFTNVVVLAGAIWDRPAKLAIDNPTAGAGAYRVTAQEGDLRAYTISEIMGVEASDLFIVKVDIEGGEQALFRSNTDWISATRLIVLELHDWLYPGEGTSSSFVRAVSEHEFDFVFRGENFFCFKVIKKSACP